MKKYSSALAVSAPFHSFARPSGRAWLMMGLGLALCAGFFLNLALGSVTIPLGDIATIIAGGEPAKASWSEIVLNFRLPKALTATLAGAALAVGGLQMQTLFRNPLADPFILGINSGASLGVALIVLSTGAATGFLAAMDFLSSLSLIGAAILGGGLVMMLVIAVAQRVRSNMTLLILGLMFGYATGALVSVLLYFSVPEQIQAYIAWTFGSFGGVTWGQMRLLAPAVLLGLALAYLLIKPLNALQLGEAYARSMGLTVARARFWIIASTALLAGAVTACCGPIGFLGVAVPHLCRALLNTSDHRILVPATIIMGGTIALIADLVAGLPGSSIVLPLNAITALLGAPVVVWIILRRSNLRESFAA